MKLRGAIVAMRRTQQNFVRVLALTIKLYDDDSETSKIKGSHITHIRTRTFTMELAARRMRETEYSYR